MLLFRDSVPPNRSEDFVAAAFYDLGSRVNQALCTSFSPSLSSFAPTAFARLMRGASSSSTLASALRSLDPPAAWTDKKVFHPTDTTFLPTAQQREQDKGSMYKVSQAARWLYESSPARCSHKQQPEMGRHDAKVDGLHRRPDTHGSFVCGQPGSLQLLFRCREGLALEEVGGSEEDADDQGRHDDLVQQHLQTCTR